MVIPAPALSTWAIDPEHSTVEFSLQYMGIGCFRARFRSLTGSIQTDEAHPADSSVQVTIPVASVDVTNTTLYDWLLAPEFFNATEHPDITFHSTDLQRVDDSRWQVAGALTIAGRTQPVVLETVYHGQVPHPFAGRPMAAFTAHTTLQRSAFGLGWNLPLASGVAALGEAVQVQIEINAFRQD